MARACCWLLAQTKVGAIANPPTCARGGMGRAAWLQCQKGRKATLYLIRCYGNGEAFYKVGITFCLGSRFRPMSMPYRWRTIARYSSYNAGRVWDLEQLLHGSKFAKYTPLLPFAGAGECYASSEELLAAMPAKTFILKPVTVDI
jgi:hypothetical protein